MAEPLALLDWPRKNGCSAHGTLGMVDTGVDAGHPALKGQAIERESVRGPQYRASSTGHGTAIAILMVGHGAFEGASPQAKLVAIDAFHRQGAQDLADTFDLVTAIDRLVARKITVINLSLAGPKNDVLDKAGQSAVTHGTIIIAAAGNDGPKGPPRYPAAYPWAVAVTAVDGNMDIYPRAERGDYIALAAPGVRLALPDVRLKTRYYSGTSFAAPFVTAALGTMQGLVAGAKPEDLVTKLKASAKDLGAPGPDPVFGAGLLQMGAVCGRS